LILRIGCLIGFECGFSNKNNDCKLTVDCGGTGFKLNIAEFIWLLCTL